MHTVYVSYFYPVTKFSSLLLIIPPFLLHFFPFVLFLYIQYIQEKVSPFLYFMIYFRTSDGLGLPTTTITIN